MVTTSSQATIEEIFQSLTPEAQAEALKQLIETMKAKPLSDKTPPLSPVQGQKRILQSPNTPHKGGARKVIILNKFFLQLDFDECQHFCNEEKVFYT
jgi:hypothetical protein